MRNARWLAPTAFAGLIFAVSSIPGSSMPSGAIWSFDKVIHALEYGVLGVLIYWALDSLAGASRIAIAISAAILFGVFDELYQTSVPGRAGDPFDAAADTIGAAAGVLAAFYLQKKRAANPDKPTKRRSK